VKIAGSGAAGKVVRPMTGSEAEKVPRWMNV